MMATCDGTSAARRKRERRLRSWWRHEQQSVRAAVAAALHHSRDVGPRTAHDALRDRSQLLPRRRQSSSRCSRETLSGRLPCRSSVWLGRGR